ncbi:hypothetical protein MLD38_028963 [Melastoma candidum]|uniref:Uncharacterized protein n=1 Tax=Melastoma candidum TaxID=119954 RepID=A0ACB9N297_9MYRT|nr:hypothetical protein MLD38_028963 [Melastoma candidum]
MDYEPRPHRHRRTSDCHHPSFSSSLLDAIYRSIDETNHDPPTHHRRKDSLTLYDQVFPKDVIDIKGGSNTSSRRSCAVEKWTAAGINSERYLVVRRDSSAGRSFVPGNSRGSSSDSSGFLSSELEFAGTRSSSSCYSMKRPKPIRKSISVERAPTAEFRSFLQAQSGEESRASAKTPQREGSNVLKERSMAKSYVDSKKAIRQPISPGGKLASFLNSIFNAKKARITVQALPEPSDHSTCSSASSFSRSCLSVKTPSSTASSTSRRKSAEKRSVRFCPVSVVLDEDCHPCGHNSLVDTAGSRTDISRRTAAAVASAAREFDVVMEENRRVAEAAREMLRNYQKRKESYDNGDEDEEDDAASCASSDLFELDNLERYREELPVYGTTSVGANLAIANGLTV